MLRLVLFLCFLGSFAAHAADCAREKVWAVEITPANPSPRKVLVPGSDRFFNGWFAELVRRAAIFLQDTLNQERIRVRNA